MQQRLADSILLASFVRGRNGLRRCVRNTAAILQVGRAPGESPYPPYGDRGGHEQGSWRIPAVPGEPS